MQAPDKTNSSFFFKTSVPLEAHAGVADGGPCSQLAAVIQVVGQGLFKRYSLSANPAANPLAVVSYWGGNNRTLATQMTHSVANSWAHTIP